MCRSGRAVRQGAGGPCRRDCRVEKTVSIYEQSKKAAEKFIALIDKYQGSEAMTNTMLNEIIDKILVHERDRKGCRDTTQTVEIYFNFVGRYIPPSFRDVELTRRNRRNFAGERIGGTSCIRRSFAARPAASSRSMTGGTTPSAGPSWTQRGPLCGPRIWSAVSSPPPPDRSLGKYGLLRLRYLKEYRPIVWAELVTGGKLYAHPL